MLMEDMQDQVVEEQDIIEEEVEKQDVTGEQAEVEGTLLKHKKKKEKKTGWKYELLDLVKTFIICFIAVFLISHYIISPVQVDGSSMKPTLQDNDLGLMNIMNRKMSGVKRYDVVIVYNEQYDEDWVKRVIGLPGDSIYAKDDVVYVNGKAIEEPYLDTDYANAFRESGNHFTQDFDIVELGEDEYFLMGDNRIDSTDSRVVGAFKGKDIIGKDVYVFYPFNHMKIVGNGAI